MDPTTVTAVSNSFLKEGILGSIIVVLLIVCGAIWRAYLNSNNARITEASEYADKYVGLLEKVMEAQRDTNTVLEIIKDRIESRRPRS